MHAVEKVRDRPPHSMALWPWQSQHLLEPFLCIGGDNALLPEGKHF